MSALGDGKHAFPKAAQKGVKIDKNAWVAEIDEHVAALGPALASVAREAREADATGSEKAKAMTDNDELFARGARFISAALALVGEDDLASKTRPSARKPGTTLAAGGEEGDAPPPGEGPAAAG